MTENRPRISVLIITYNQQEVIDRTMQSLLSQKDCIYEICINDDCSTDGTFAILEGYQRKFPELVKPVRNEENLGIFRNIETVQKRPSGDVVYALSGDDECPDGYFAKVLEFIEKNDIDWRDESFCIYGDFVQINDDGSSRRFRNNMVLRHPALKLKIRQLLSERGACYGIRLLRKFPEVADGRSFAVEMAQDARVQIFSERNYYLPEVGNRYYAHIGISSRMSREQMAESAIGCYSFLLFFLESLGIRLDRKDLAFIEFMTAYKRGKLWRSVVYYFRSIDFSLGFGGLQFGRMLFSLQYRLHRRKAQKH